MRKQLLLIICLTLISVKDAISATADVVSDRPEMADVMRSNGKIYVVVTVLATIFAGIFGYLVYLDRKISRLENEK
jgi:CcmD family protein